MRDSLAKLAQATGGSNIPTKEDIALLQRLLEQQINADYKITAENYNKYLEKLDSRQRRIFEEARKKERLAQQTAERTRRFRENVKSDSAAGKRIGLQKKELNRIDKPQINPYLAAVLGLFGPAALFGGLYGTYRSAKEKDLFRSILYGALSGAGGGALYRFHTALTEGLDLPSIWAPLAIGALIGAGGGVGAYGLGRLLG